MTKKEKQDNCWKELDFDTKRWVYDHYRKYCNYKISRSTLIAFLDWLFGSSYVLEEAMIKEYGEHNIIKFNYD